MSHHLLQKSKVIVNQLKTDLPSFKVGSIIAVHYQLIDGDKKRTQIFKGLVTNLKGVKNTSKPKNIDSSVTVTKNSVNGIKVERTFPLSSPLIEKIEILDSRRSRRSNLNKLTLERKDYAKSGRFKIFTPKQVLTKSNKIQEKELNSDSKKLKEKANAEAVKQKNSKQKESESESKKPNKEVKAKKVEA